MIVYYNDNQENLLNELKEINRSSSGIFKKDLIKELRDILIKKEEFLVKVQVSRDGLLGSLRRIEWAYKEHEKIPFDYQGHDEREALMLVFFHNAKCFIEIFKKFPLKTI